MIPERVEIFMQVVVTLVCLLVVLPLFIILIRKYCSSGKIMQQTKFQLEAKAIILSIEHTGIMVSQQTQVKLQLQVLPEKGRNFVAEIKEAFTVTALAALQTGAVMKVTYNPSNIKEVFLIGQL